MHASIHEQDRDPGVFWITRPSPSPGPLARAFGMEDEDASALASICEVVEFKAGDTMQPATERTSHVLFVVRGMASSCCARNGTEADLVLAPDVVGASALLGVPGTGYTVRAMTAVTAHRAGVPDLAMAMQASAGVRSTVLALAGSSMERLRRRTACHLLHKPEARLASWILHHHGTGQGPLRVTHDTLATLLGVRRPTVTVTLHGLESMKAVTARRSCIEVRDASRLRERACSCHRPFAEERGSDAETLLRALAMVDRSPPGRGRGHGAR